MAVRPRSFEAGLPSSDPVAVVISVQKIAGNNLKWTFNTNVTSDSIASIALQDNSLSSAAQPISTVQNGPTAVTAGYSALPAIGNTWQLTPPVLHLTSPGGFGPTQSGTVT